MASSFIFNSNLNDGTPFSVNKLKDKYEFYFGNPNCPTYTFEWKPDGLDEIDGTLSKESINQKEQEALGI